MESGTTVPIFPRLKSKETLEIGMMRIVNTYDPAGNMAGIPNPQLLSAQYDAWNRLVSISDGANTVSQHIFDARGYRIRKDMYTSGTLTETRHYYCTPGWQCVEERTGTLTTLERQFVWGLRYIDDLVLRDRSTANNGVINERRYAMQDDNWNTVAICDITGFVSERFAYSAYGTPVFMTGTGVVQVLQLLDSRRCTAVIVLTRHLKWPSEFGSVGTENKQVREQAGTSHLDKGRTPRLSRDCSTTT